MGCCSRNFPYSCRYFFGSAQRSAMAATPDVFPIGNSRMMNRTLPVSMYSFLNFGKVSRWKCRQCGQVSDAYLIDGNRRVGTAERHLRQRAGLHDVGEGRVGDHLPRGLDLARDRRMETGAPSSRWRCPPELRRPRVVSAVGSLSAVMPPAVTAPPEQPATAASSGNSASRAPFVLTSELSSWPAAARSSCRTPPSTARHRAACR